MRIFVTSGYSYRLGELGDRGPPIIFSGGCADLVCPGNFAVVERDILEMRKMRLVRILTVRHTGRYAGDDRILQSNGKIVFLRSRFAGAVPLDLAFGQFLTTRTRLI